MSHISVRVTGKDAMDAAVKFLVDNETYEGYAVREVAEQEHMHAVVLNRDIDEFRAKLRWAVRRFGSGNKVYSVSKVKDLDHYLRYMAKGESRECLPEVIWCRYEGLDVRGLHAMYWEQNEVLKKKAEKPDVVALVLRKCIENKVDPTDSWSEEAVIDAYIDVCCESNAVKFDRFNGMRIVDTVRLKLSVGTSKHRDIKRDLRDAMRR